MKAPALQLCVFRDDSEGWDWWGWGGSGIDKVPRRAPTGRVLWWRQVSKAEAGCPWGAVRVDTALGQDVLGLRNPEGGGRGVCSGCWWSG